MYIRKIVSILLVIILLGSAIVPVTAADLSTKTVQEKAEALNKLGLLSGDAKGNFNLNSGLKRSEAVTFIVGILGKKAEVTKNSNIYKYTKFPDVKDTDWFAAYVGYCVENKILSGNTDGTFKPNDNVSEKAFLTMLMNALGHQSGTDFTWSDIYQYAYSIGLLTDAEYETKTDDNTKYVRGDVADILYDALTLNRKDSTYTVLQSLVNEGAIARNKAVETGLLTDTVATAVTKVTPGNELNITVELNESVKELTDADFSVYSTKDKSKKLNVTMKTQDGSVIVLKTSSQTPDTSYQLEINNVEDFEGNIYEKIVYQFTGYKNTGIVSDYFKISKVEVVSKSLINVYFTHPVNANTQNSVFYELLYNGDVFAGSDDISVGLLGSSNNGISLSLKGTYLTEGEEYTLNISGSLTSIYGVRLGEGTGESIGFIGKSTDNEEFQMVKASVINSRTLQLDFNRELNQTTAEYSFSYSITDSNNIPIPISKAAVVKDGANSGKSVTLSTYSAFDKTKTYNVMIFQAYTVDRESSIIEKSYSFSGYYTDSAELNISSVTPADVGTLIVYFNKPVDEKSANTVTNFMIKGVAQTNYTAFPVKTYFSKDTPNMVKLYLPSYSLLESSKTYTLTVQPTLMDSTGTAINRQLTSSVFGVNGSGSANVKPRISKAVTISNDTIKVTFNKEISLDVPNILNTNYTLEYIKDGQTYTKIPLSANYIDATTMSLKFDILETGLNYKLSFTTLKDYSGNNITSSTDTDTSVEVEPGQ